MELETLAPLFSRWIHIVFAAILLGGTIFARFALMKACKSLPEEQRKEFHAQVRSGWSRLVMLSIGILLVTGLTNFLLVRASFKVEMEALPKWYNMWFGIKFILGMVIFLIASLLTGKSRAAERFRQKGGFWIHLNILLAIIVIGIGGLLHSAHNKPNLQKQSPKSKPTVSFRS